MSMTDTREPGALSIAPPAPKRESLDRRVPGIAPNYGPAYWISGALALVTAVATALTFFVPDVLRGTAVMNGSGRLLHPDAAKDHRIEAAQGRRLPLTALNATSSERT